MKDMKAKYGAEKGKHVFYATAAKRGMPSYEQGGIVKKTGPAVVHQGELIVPRDHPRRGAVEEMLKAAEEGRSPKTAGENASFMSRLRRRGTIAGGD
jgi:hypothetical protein